MGGENVYLRAPFLKLRRNTTLSLDVLVARSLCHFEPIPICHPPPPPPPYRCVTVPFRQHQKAALSLHAHPFRCRSPVSLPRYHRPTPPFLARCLCLSPKMAVPVPRATFSRASGSGSAGAESPYHG